jgi:hypothetical protein
MMSGRMPSATCPPPSSSSVSPASPTGCMGCLCVYPTSALFRQHPRVGIVSGSPSPSILPRKLVLVNHLPSFPPLIPLVSSFPAALRRTVTYSLIYVWVWAIYQNILRDPLPYSAAFR